MGLFIDLESDGFTQEEYNDIVLCLNTLLSVRAGEQPLDREFGVDYNEIIGMPGPIAENELTLEIIEKVSVYEPRVMVERVECTYNVNGQLIPRVYFAKNEDDYYNMGEEENYSEDEYYPDGEDEEIYYEDELEV